jgi:hypothetical protein
MGATASAFGVKPKPASTFTFSRTTSSVAMRLAASGLGPPTSLITTSTRLPATLSPCIF